jgi:cation diffusion facilitator family transporter
MQHINRGIKTVLIGVLLNALLAVIKIITGILGNSYALIADGIESTTDIFSSLIVWGGLKISARPADDNHPYGHGKAESLAAFVVSVALLGAALIIVIQSVKEIITPHHLPATFTLYVLVGVVLTKEILYRVVFKTGNEINSTAMKADAWHHRSDAITSAAAFIGISIAVIGGEGYEMADDWAALVASGFIAFNGIRMMRFALHEIMDTVPGSDVELKIRNLAMQTDGVMDVEKCYIRKSGISFIIDIHIEVDAELSVSRGHEIAHNLKDRLVASNLSISYVAVHVEPYLQNKNDINHL